MCRVTYTTNATGSCVSCAANCDFCDQSGPATCDLLSCSIGYTRYNSTTCLPCLEGCSSCTALYPFACIGCLIGSYNDSATGRCLNCPEGCYNCSAAACTSCVEYYYLSSGQCVRYCGLPCVGCSWSGVGVQNCTACVRGYTLVNGTCVSSLDCSSQSIC